MTTPGYVIGTYNGRLQDGTSYRIPMIGWETPDGKDLENNGVKPDITVEQGIRIFLTAGMAMSARIRARRGDDRVGDFRV